MLNFGGGGVEYDMFLQKGFQKITGPTAESPKHELFYPPKIVETYLKQ